MTTRHLEIGSSVGSCEVTDIEPKRLRIAQSLVLSIVIGVVGAAIVILDVLLLQHNFNVHLLYLFPPIVKTILFVMPFIALIILWTMGESFDFDIANNRIEHRTHYVQSKQFAAGNVAQVALVIGNGASDSWVDVNLKDSEGRHLLTCCHANLQSQSWHEPFRLAGDLAPMFGLPVTVEGEALNAFEAAKTLVETVRSTQEVPLDFKVF